VGIFIIVSPRKIPFMKRLTFPILNLYAKRCVRLSYNGIVDPVTFFPNS